MKLLIILLSVPVLVFLITGLPAILYFKFKDFTNKPAKGLKSPKIKAGKPQMLYGSGFLRPARVGGDTDELSYLYDPLFLPETNMSESDAITYYYEPNYYDPDSF